MWIRFTNKQWLWFYGIGLGFLFLAILELTRLGVGLSVSFLDVGQGDAILIQTPEHHQILIDAGPGSAVLEGLGRRMDFFDKDIDLFVLSHPDRDHFAGILDVLQKYRINTVLMSGVVSGDAEYRDFLNQISANKTSVWFAQSDQDLEVSPGVVLDVLYPLAGQSYIGQEPVDKNNTSVVMRLVERAANRWGAEEWRPLILFTGDAEEPEEKMLLASGQELRAETLKLGHHGSKTATSDAFLAAVNPKTAIISVGADNKFGHPHAETLAKLGSMPVRRTDKGGDITFKYRITK